MEGFAKYESDINKASSLNKEFKKEAAVNDTQNDSSEEVAPEKPKKKGFNVGDIITYFSNKTGLFRQGDIE